MPAIQGKKLSTIKCPLCDQFSSKRITTFDKHLIDSHNTTSQLLWDKLNDGPILCGCGCKSVTTWISWLQGYSTARKGHNANIVAYYGEEKAKEISERRNAKLRGKAGWSRGLTKENDDRIMCMAKAISVGRKKSFDEGKIKIWSKGLTKNTDERLAEKTTKQIKGFKSGKYVAWTAGLTEESDERVRIKNDQLRQRYANNELIPWHKGKTKIDDPRLTKIWTSRDPVKEYAHVRWSNEEIEKQLQNNTQVALESIENYRNDRKPALNVRCRSCNWVAKVTLVFARNDRCPDCEKIGSIGQTQITNYVESLGFKAGQNIKGVIGRSELDIYVPAKKFAIEFNGLYYHNESAGKDSNYHQNKTNSCNKLGITLLHVFEDEWYNKPHIIKSIIRHRLGTTNEKINARSCEMVNVIKEERAQFFNDNHLDGDTHAEHTIGLKYNNRLVAAISLRKPFHKKHSEKLEVARFCVVLDTNVRGALNKLSNAALKLTKSLNYTGMISYVDCRLGSGNNWKNSSWNLVGETDERFWWTDCHNRFNRFKFKADKSRNMSETQIAEEANVVKIWGCKNFIFEMC